MLPTFVIALQALALTSASVVRKRQDGGVASNIPSQATVDEPARGEGRRILGQLFLILALRVIELMV